MLERIQSSTLRSLSDDDVQRELECLAEDLTKAGGTPTQVIHARRILLARRSYLGEYALASEERDAFAPTEPWVTPGTWALRHLEAAPLTAHLGSAQRHLANLQALCLMADVPLLAQLLSLET